MPDEVDDLIPRRGRGARSRVVVGVGGGGVREIGRIGRGAPRPRGEPPPADVAVVDIHDVVIVRDVVQGDERLLPGAGSARLASSGGPGPAGRRRRRARVLAVGDNSLLIIIVFTIL